MSERTFLKMVNIEINFQVFHPEHLNIDNNTLYNIRKLIGETFENADFGTILDNSNIFTGNTFAIPITDEYYTPDNELFIQYTFSFPLHHGNFSDLAGIHIPQLHNRIRNEFGLLAFIRIIYS